MSPETIIDSGVVFREWETTNENTRGMPMLFKERCSFLRLKVVVKVANIKRMPAFKRSTEITFVPLLRILVFK